MRSLGAKPSQLGAVGMSASWSLASRVLLQRCDTLGQRALGAESSKQKECNPKCSCKEKTSTISKRQARQTATAKTNNITVGTTIEIVHKRKGAHVRKVSFCVFGLTGSRNQEKKALPKPGTNSHCLCPLLFVSVLCICVSHSIVVWVALGRSPRVCLLLSDGPSFKISGIVKHSPCATHGKRVGKHERGSRSDRGMSS